LANDFGTLEIKPAQKLGKFQENKFALAHRKESGSVNSGGFLPLGFSSMTKSI
jgi:hypothetical protein